jgi:hypothetical protein
MKSLLQWSMEKAPTLKSFEESSFGDNFASALDLEVGQRLSISPTLQTPAEEERNAGLRKLRAEGRITDTEWNYFKFDALASGAVDYEGMADYVNREKGFKEIADSEMIRQQNLKYYADQRGENEELASRAGFKGQVGQLAGMMAGQLREPLNYVGVGLGLKQGATFLSKVGIAMASESAVQLPLQYTLTQTDEEFGTEYTTGEAVVNGLFGVGFAGGLTGLAHGVGRMTSATAIKVMEKFGLDTHPKTRAVYSRLRSADPDSLADEVIDADEELERTLNSEIQAGRDIAGEEPILDTHKGGEYDPPGPKPEDELPLDEVIAAERLAKQDRLKTLTQKERSEGLNEMEMDEFDILTDELYPSEKQSEPTTESPTTTWRDAYLEDDVIDPEVRAEYKATEIEEKAVSDCLAMVGGGA